MNEIDDIFFERFSHKDWVLFLCRHEAWDWAKIQSDPALRTIYLAYLLAMSTEEGAGLLDYFLTDSSNEFIEFAGFLRKMSPTASYWADQVTCLFAPSYPIDEVTRADYLMQVTDGLNVDVFEGYEKQYYSFLRAEIDCAVKRAILSHSFFDQ